MAKRAPTSNVPATKKSTPVTSSLDFSSDAGAGFEGAGREAFAIPFLIILQSGSPQCKRSDGAYVKGATEGMLFNTATQELFDSDAGVEIIPCAFAQTFVEWKVRESGGGFVAEWDSAAGKALREKTRRDDKSREILPNGNQLNDTRNHYILFKDGEGQWQPALMSLTSTQIKASRNWMTSMQRLCATQHVPMFALVYRVTTTAQSNDKGSWYGYSFEYTGLVNDADTYTAAKALYEQARTGQVKIQQREDIHADAAGHHSDGDNPDDM